jgi:hypothetical protein
MNPRNRNQSAQKTRPTAKQEKNGADERKFPRPQAWALRWDGRVLTQVRREDERPPQKPKSR